MKITLSKGLFVVFFLASFATTLITAPFYPQQGPEVGVFLDKQYLSSGGQTENENVSLPSHSQRNVEPQQTLKVENTLDEMNKQELIFIYHYHNRESWLPELDHAESASEAFDPVINITMLGERLQERLQAVGIG